MVGRNRGPAITLDLALGQDDTPSVFYLDKLLVYRQSRPDRGRALASDHASSPAPLITSPSVVVGLRFESGARLIEALTSNRCRWNLDARLFTLLPGRVRPPTYAWRSRLAPVERLGNEHSG
jgi:hypothetical protein